MTWFLAKITLLSLGAVSLFFVGVCLGEQTDENIRYHAGTFFFASVTAMFLIALGGFL